MDKAVANYMAAISPEHRCLFDRIHRLILEACPGAVVVLSYKMPTFKVGKHRLHLAAWEHGISVYGWKARGDAGFTARHPELQTSTGTIRLRAEDAALISDDEVRDSARSVLVL